MGDSKVKRHKFTLSDYIKMVRNFVLDEIFDFSLYVAFRKITNSQGLIKILDELIETERKHIRMWSDFLAELESQMSSFSTSPSSQSISQFEEEQKISGFGVGVGMKKVSGEKKHHYEDNSNGAHFARFELDFRRKVKFFALTLLARIFGDKAIYIILESIEIHGIKKYLDIWEILGGGSINSSDEIDLSRGNLQADLSPTASEPASYPFGQDFPFDIRKMRELLKEILKDELVHEDKVVVGQEEEKITPEFVRNLFLGLSDGLVEVLGAVSGFLASFESTSSVLLAGSIVALAGAMSMGAGTFVAVSSEREVEKIKIKKEEFLGNKLILNSQSPLKQAFVVGFSYLLGALIPILPVALGMKSIILVFLSSFVVLVFTSYAVSFLSGVKYRTHLFRSVAIITGITLITFAFSSFAKNVLGINL